MRGRVSGDERGMSDKERRDWGEEGGVMGWVRKKGRWIRGKGCLTV